MSREREQTLPTFRVELLKQQQTQPCNNQLLAATDLSSYRRHRLEG